MSASQRAKGQRGEREFCSALGEHLGESLHRELGAVRDGGTDVLVGSWAVEVKRAETLELAAWWAQAWRQAVECHRIPALAYRASRRPWTVLVPLDVMLFGERVWDSVPLEFTAALSLAGFATVIHETAPNKSQPSE